MPSMNPATAPSTGLERWRYVRTGGSALFTAWRTSRRWTPNFRATPLIVPIPNSYSRRNCSNSSTFVLLSTPPLPLVQRKDGTPRQKGGPSFDGGKKIKGIKIHLAVDKYGFPLAIHVSAANQHDGKGIVPVLHQLAGRGFKGTALGDLSYRGERLSKAGEALGITIQPSAGGHGGTFIPEGIRWVVERSLAWISRYRRLNTIFERTEGHLVAFIEIAFISILSRRLVRLGTQEISA